MSLTPQQVLDATIEGSDLLAGEYLFKMLGSATIAGASPADVDFLAYKTQAISDQMNFFLDRGFECCSEDYEEPDNGVKWVAFRKGHINVIITNDYGWFVLFCRASYVCKQLGLLDKEQRKLVHRIIRDNEYPLDLQ